MESGTIANFVNFGNVFPQLFSDLTTNHHFQTCVCPAISDISSINAGVTQDMVYSLL